MTWVRRPGPARVRETAVLADPPVLRHGRWAEAMPWLVQGITWRGPEEQGYDLGLFGRTPVGKAMERWRRLLDTIGTPAAVHSRQVHGRTVLVHEQATPGLRLAPDADAHATRTPGLLLTVSVADCVPVYLVDPVQRAIALLHAGWRGLADGVIEAGVATLTGAFGSNASELHAHLGPAICGECYEVGPEVHARLGLIRPPEPRRVDLRMVAARRLLALGLQPAHITRSSACPRCASDMFFSHRAGSPGRQMAFLAIRPATR